HGGPAVEPDIGDAFGEGFVMGRALGDLRDVLRLALPFAVSVGVDKVVRQVTLERGRVLFDGPLPPALGGLTDSLGRVRGEYRDGHGEQQHETSSHIEFLHYTVAFLRQGLYYHNAFTAN